jgi:hypothetical protein
VTGAVRAAWPGLAACLAGLASQAAAAANVESGLSHCAAIADAGARLACYDTLAGRSPQGPAAVPEHAVAAPLAGSSPAAALATAPVATAPVAAVPAAATASAAAPPPAATAAATVDPATATRNFGLSAAQLHTADQGPKSIEAHITKIIVDQNRRGAVVLDNGQTWVLLEGEMLMDTGEAVTISRAALGSFMLTSASHHSYHVRRVR